MIKKERAILIPFEIDPNGNVAYTTNENHLWDERVVSVLGTVGGTRLQRPTFGLTSLTMPFDTREEVKESLERAVAEAFAAWLPNLRLLSASVIDEDGNDVVVVRYVLPNLDVATSQVTVGQITLDGPNPASEDRA